jgi:ATP-dependent DNA helicase DinG
VCEAFNAPRLLMFEAGTGTGKSMAYLVPAIAWACQNQDKVIISTNTRNLQEQLCRKDLPFLRGLVGGRFDVALLKGRTNYLCVRRLLHTVQHFERELNGPVEMIALMPVITWFAQTETGDVSECNGLLCDSNAPAVLARITSAGDECAGRACRSRAGCYVRRARALAQLADIVVVNHALLFADCGLDQPHLPPARNIIFDEAHNVEDVATEAMAVTADTLAFYRITNRLWRERRDGSGSGMIATVLAEADKCLKDGGPLSKGTVRDLAAGVIETVDELVKAVRACFDTLEGPFEAVLHEQEALLLSDCDPPVNLESETGRAADKVARVVQKLCNRIEELAECLELNAKHLRRADELALDLRACAEHLKEAVDALKFVLRGEDGNFVYWAERTRRGSQNFYALKAAPIQIGDFFRKAFLDAKRCIVLTSATLRVNGRFDYMLERLGAVGLGPDRLTCAAEGSGFDYDRQTLVCAATFLPEAGGQRDPLFDEELSSFLIDLLEATSGRALVLFTSYSMLDFVYGRIKGPLERIGIPVLAQGHGGSREMLTSMFRDIVSSVLLGTQSFWEGVDIGGETMSCLVVTKLPFHVPTEPIAQGRIRRLNEQNLNSFQHYTLPRAVISFRQGFGRLIRNRSDRGVVVVTDRRLVTQKYGKAFQRDLPTRCHVFRERRPLLIAVRQFLEKRR